MAYPHESTYKKDNNWGENKDCGSSEFSGTKSSQREQIFCKKLTCKDDVIIEPDRVTVGDYEFLVTKARVSVLDEKSGLYGFKIGYILFHELPDNPFPNA